MRKVFWDKCLRMLFFESIDVYPDNFGLHDIVVGEVFSKPIFRYVLLEKTNLF